MHTNGTVFQSTAAFFRLTALEPFLTHADADVCAQLYEEGARVELPVRRPVSHTL